MNYKIEIIWTPEYYKVILSGEEVLKVDNPKVGLFASVSLYLSDPWHDSIHDFGTVSNFQVLQFE